MYIVVTGPPASGKSTLAAGIAGELALPLLAKDTIKAGLVEALGAEDVEGSRLLGAGAVRALLAVARENGQGVLDSVWVDRDRALGDLADLPGPVIEVFCRCPRSLMEERYAARAAGRPSGHFDAQRRPDELWNESSLTPLSGPWHVVEVDTSGPVELLALVEWLLAMAGRPDLVGQAPEPSPIDTRGELVMLTSLALRTARALLSAGILADPFAVIAGPVGVSAVVAPGRWLHGPPDWSMSSGGESSELVWVRNALEHTGARHRAIAFVTVSEDEGLVRVVAEHRADGSRLERSEPVPRP